MTKDEIIKLANGYYAGHKWTGQSIAEEVKQAWVAGFQFAERRSILKDMTLYDEYYPKQHAIEFANWLDKMGFGTDMTGKWYNYQDANLTIEELYDEFIKQQESIL